MAARAIWKGKLKLGSKTIPVDLYSAIVDKTVHFNILEARTKSRVKQHMVNPETNKEVASEEIQKGYQLEPGTFVILTEEELAKLEPEPSRDIEVIRFVSPEQLGSQWYDRPYYLGPDGDEKAYFAFVEALENKEKQGIARWVMRGKEYIGALAPRDGYLTLVTLRHAGEVVSAAELPEPAGRALDKKELAMAKQLVELLEGEFDPAEFTDEYRERLMDFIEKKAKGRKPRLRAVEAKRPSPSLETTLSKSIANLKRQKEKKAA